MRNREIAVTIFVSAIFVLLFVAAGFFIGIEHVAKASTYFVFENIIIFSYGLAGVGTIVALIKYFDPVSIGLIICHFVISVGRLYFLNFRTFHRLALALFALCLIYTVYYWVRFSNTEKGRVRVQNIKAANGVIPVAYIGFPTLFGAFKLLNFIDTEMYTSVIWVGVSVVLSIVAVILGTVFIKDRSDRKEYIGKLCALFFLPLVLTFILPLVFTEYTNYVFDSSISEEVQFVVVDKYTKHQSKGGRSHHVVVSNDGKKIHFSTDEIVYDNYDVGDIMPLYKQDGAYDMPYYEYRLDEIYKYNK